MFGGSHFPSLSIYPNIFLAKHQAFFAQNLKNKINELKTKINRLTDASLERTFKLSEFQQTKKRPDERKENLKLSHSEQKGNHWLELVRNWILEANQAKIFSKLSARTAALGRENWRLILKSLLIFSHNCPPKRGAKRRATCLQARQGRLINFGGTF